VAQAATITFKGRRFEPEEVALIEQVVASYRRLSRQELANTICELLEWRRPNGGLKTWCWFPVCSTCDLSGSFVTSRL
jgi:hypothetical protein